MSQFEKSSPAAAEAGSRAAVVFAVLHVALFVASLMAVPALAPGAKIPNPFGPDAASRSFFLDHAYAIRVSDLLQLASAVCLGALAATLGGAYARGADRSRITATGLTLVGGGGAAMLLALTALCSWAIASPGGGDPGTAFRTLQFLPFLMGGPGWAAFHALLLAGITAGGAGRLPRWAVGMGYFLAAVSALAMLVLVTINAAPCLPIARFLGFIWLILAAWYVTRKTARIA